MTSRSSPAISSSSASESLETSFSVSSMPPAQESESEQHSSPTKLLSNNEANEQVALQILEKNVEFMSFFYQHITGCPPHGPFRIYCALTFVERAQKRFGSLLHAVNNNSNSSRNGVQDMYLHSPLTLQKLCSCITIRNVLALIDKHFNTRHLNSWALLYVPAEIHLCDVERLIQQSKKAIN